MLRWLLCCLSPVIARSSCSGSVEVLEEHDDALGQTGHQRKEARRHRGPQLRAHQERDRSVCDTLELSFHSHIVANRYPVINRASPQSNPETPENESGFHTLAHTTGSCGDGP